MERGRAACCCIAAGFGFGEAWRKSAMEGCGSFRMPHPFHRAWHPSDPIQSLHPVEGVWPRPSVPARAGRLPFGCRPTQPGRIVLRARRVLLQPTRVVLRLSRELLRVGGKVFRLSRKPFRAGGKVFRLSRNTFRVRRMGSQNARRRVPRLRRRVTFKLILGGQ